MNDYDPLAFRRHLIECEEPVCATCDDASDHLDRCPAPWCSTCKTIVLARRDRWNMKKGA